MLKLSSTESGPEIGLPNYKNIATTIFLSGIAAANPEKSVKNFLSSKNGKIVIKSNGKRKFRFTSYNKVIIIAFGKAAIPMTMMTKKIIPTAKLKDCVVVTNHENYKKIPNFKVFGAGHPWPDSSGVKASRTILKIMKNTQKKDLILTLISGGGSALLPAPLEDVQAKIKITLTDKIRMTKMLLKSGATINEVNTVRKKISMIKGGKLALSAYPANLHALILSDVLGDDLSSIASGPTVPDKTKYIDAKKILKKYKIWNSAPKRVIACIDDGCRGRIPENYSNAYSKIFTHSNSTIVGSNAISLSAIEKKAKKYFKYVEIWNQSLTGEASVQARKLAKYLKSKSKRPMAILAGGEMTVTIVGKGKGGRNQEFALAFALEAERLKIQKNWTLLSAGTDGRDGPTNAAGGIVNNFTIKNIRKKRLSPERLLRNNDSYKALKAANALFVTGATGTNVADLQILLIH
jgi:glycerate-2-kinase